MKVKVEIPNKNFYQLLILTPNTLNTPKYSVVVIKEKF